MKNENPKIAVLLAAYNGEKYIEEQIESIINQQNVNLHLFISIDQSTDKTLEVCRRFENRKISILQPFEKRFGSAAKNFYFLIKNVPVEDFDFIAFSDQDDIWNKDKIERAIFSISDNYVGYSSNVKAFWENGKTKIIKKNYPQKKYDYIFEAPGPGCTFLIKKEGLILFKERIKNENLYTIPEHHDWLIYAFFRNNGLKWKIDAYPSMLYRQHISNQVGANIGFQAIIKRFMLLKKGNFKNEYQSILKFIYFKDFDTKDIRKKILKNPFVFRRKIVHSLVIFLSAIFNKV